MSMAGENLGDEGRERKTGQEIIGDVDIACGVRGSCGHRCSSWKRWNEGQIK